MRFYYDSGRFTDARAFVVERHNCTNKSLIGLLRNLIEHRLAYPVRIDTQEEGSPTEQVIGTVRTYLGNHSKSTKVEAVPMTEVADDATFGISYGGLPGSEIPIENRSVVVILPFVTNSDTNFWLAVIDLPLFVESSGCASPVYFPPSQCGVTCHAYTYTSDIGGGLESR